MSTTPATGKRHGPEKLGWVRLLRTGGFRRLLAVRFAAQWGDGMFQAALGGAVLFNPEREADPLAVAAGLAVVLLPYSVVGPFAGALLDRWDRRRVLLVANLVRAVLTLVVAVLVATGAAGVPPDGVCASERATAATSSPPQAVRAKTVDRLAARAKRIGRRGIAGIGCRSGGRDTTRVTDRRDGRCVRPCAGASPSACHRYLTVN